MDFVIFFVCLNALTSSLLLCNVIGWTVSIFLGFYLNIYFAFPLPRKISTFMKYTAIALLSLVASSVTLLIVSKVAPVLIAKVCAVGASFCMSFPLTRGLAAPQSKGQA
jgi:putative flippase GtrA